MIAPFDERPGGTLLTWRQVFDKESEFKTVRAFAPAANEQNFDRLAGELDTMV